MQRRGMELVGVHLVGVHHMAGQVDYFREELRHGPLIGDCFEVLSQRLNSLRPVGYFLRLILLGNTV